MRYNIKGTIQTIDSHDIHNIELEIGKHKVSSFSVKAVRYEEDVQVSVFDVWADNEENTLVIFDSIKYLIDLHGGYADWHLCNNEENKPCVISDAYSGGNL